jgi:hypothetical protein
LDFLSDEWRCNLPFSFVSAGRIDHLIAFQVQKKGSFLFYLCRLKSLFAIWCLSQKRAVFRQFYYLFEGA